MLCTVYIVSSADLTHLNMEAPLLKRAISNLITDQVMAADDVPFVDEQTYK